jgi:Bacterial regulatory proteins, lacI family
MTEEPRRRRAVSAPTIYDVAREAGVAPSTVSRAFSRPGRVNAETAERVRAVAARLGYRTSPPARALSTGRSSMVALVIPDVTNPVYFDITRGAEDAAAEAGYTLLLADFRERGGWSAARSTGRCPRSRGSSSAAHACRTPPSGWRPSSGPRWS